MAPFSWYYNEKSVNSNSHLPSCNISDIQLRFLCPADILPVWELCSDCFPIDYPFSWYEEITSNPKFYSLAAVYNGNIIGLIVAEIKEYVKLSYEDKGIVAPCFGNSTEVGYILSLAVDKKFRRNGVATILLENFISHLTCSPEYSCCKAIFLHVLTTNTAAIHFYEHRHFKLHTFLPYYYLIKGKCKDGFTYVLYVNGGHPPTKFLLGACGDCIDHRGAPFAFQSGSQKIGPVLYISHSYLRTNLFHLSRMRNKVGGCLGTVIKIFDKKFGIGRSAYKGRGSA